MSIDRFGNKLYTSESYPDDWKFWLCPYCRYCRKGLSASKYPNWQNELNEFKEKHLAVCPDIPKQKQIRKNNKNYLISQVILDLILWLAVMLLLSVFLIL